MIKRLDAAFGKNKLILCLGHFDCFHLGHQKILDKAIELKRSKAFGSEDVEVAATTFDRSPGKERDLYGLKERLELFEKYGADSCLILNFDGVKDKGGREFVESVLSGYDVACLVCGADYTFGHDKCGVDELQKICEKYKVGLSIVPFLYYNNAKVSSSMIKRLLGNGDVEKAALLLGRNYSISGTVVKGDGIGAGLGFPTANVSPAKVIPLKRGVYGTVTAIDGREYYSVTNYGPRPTVGGTDERLETHLIGYAGGGLYGKNVELRFVKYLRGVACFNTKEELSSQIKKDTEWIND